MSIIDRYVFKTFLAGYVILVLVGIGLYTLTDLLVNLDEFTKDESIPFYRVALLIFDYYSYNLPMYYSQLGGPMMAIAAAFSVGMMLRNNELTALVAAGMPLQRLLRPLLLASVLLIVVWVANREYLLPKFAPQISRKHEDLVTERTEGVHCARDDRNAVLTAVRFFPREGLLRSVFIVEPDAAGNPEHLIRADSARWDATARTWRLERGVRITMREPLEQEGLGGSLRPEYIDEFAYGLDPAQLLLRREAQWADLLSLGQMRDLLQSRNLANRPAINMAYHVRLTQPLLQLILLLLTIPFFLSRAPTNVMAAGGQALLLTGAFYLTAFIAHSVANDEQSAALIAWVPILFFGPVGIVAAANVKT